MNLVRVHLLVITLLLLGTFFGCRRVATPPTGGYASKKEREDDELRYAQEMSREPVPAAGWTRLELNEDAKRGRSVLLPRASSDSKLEKLAASRPGLSTESERDGLHLTGKIALDDDEAIEVWTDSFSVEVGDMLSAPPPELVDALLQLSIEVISSIGTDQAAFTSADRTPKFEAWSRAIPKSAKPAHLLAIPKMDPVWVRLQRERVPDIVPYCEGKGVTIEPLLSGHFLQGWVGLCYVSATGQRFTQRVWACYDRGNNRWVLDDVRLESLVEERDLEPDESFTSLEDYQKAMEHESERVRKLRKQAETYDFHVSDDGIGDDLLLIDVE